jgi:gluconate 5-dehydrogenase
MVQDELFNIQGKTALITGSSGGLGFVFAKGLAERGVRVILNGRDKNKLQSAFEELKKEGMDADAFAFDVTKSTEIEKAAHKITEKHGIPDILINNAGIQLRHPLENFPEDDFDQVIAANLKSAYLVSGVFAKGMIERRYGKIINICSLQSKLGRATITPYAASKGGLKMMTRGMATEWARYNIQVNAMGPGYYKTAMTRALYENKEFDEWLCNRTPANRWGLPEELIGTLVYLSSDASSYINGQVIYVDGGITACI